MGVRRYTVRHGFLLAPLGYEFIMLERCHGRCLLMQFDLVRVSLVLHVVVQSCSA
jgi:hypothetical protein